MTECLKHVPVLKPAAEPYPSHPIPCLGLCYRLAAQFSGTAFHSPFHFRAQLCYVSGLFIHLAAREWKGAPLKAGGPCASCQGGGRERGVHPLPTAWAIRAVPGWTLPCHGLAPTGRGQSHWRRLQECLCPAFLSRHGPVGGTLAPGIAEGNDGWAFPSLPTSMSLPGQVVFLKEPQTHITLFPN